MVHFLLSSHFHFCSLFFKNLVQVFAPTEDAFNALPEETLRFLKSPEGKEELVEFLQFHIVESVIPSIAIAEGTTYVTSLQGENLTVTKSADGEITVNGSVVLSDHADLLARNGISHRIDTVLNISNDMGDTLLETPSSAVSFWTHMRAVMFIAMWTVVALL